MGCARWSCWWAAAIAVCAVWCGASPAFGSDAPAGLQRWVEATAREAVRGLPLENLRITYRMEWYEVPTPEEMRRLRETVARHPDHPDKRSLEAYERRLREGPSTERFHVWIGADGNWRRSNDPTHSRPTKEPSDTAWTPRATWVMGREYLTIADPRKDAQGSYNYGSWMEEFERWLGFCAFGGVALIDGLGLNPGAVVAIGDTWFIDASRDQFGTIRFSGTWNDGDGRGAVVEMRITHAPESPAEEGSRYIMSEWRDNPVLGRRMAHRVEVRAGDGRVKQVFVVENIEVADGAFIDRIIAVPDFEGADPIRGPLVFSRVQDRRSGTDQYLTIDRSGGGVRTIRTGVGSAPTHSSDGVALWRQVGRGAAAAIALVLVVLRVRRIG